LKYKAQNPTSEQILCQQNPEINFELHIFGLSDFELYIATLFFTLVIFKRFPKLNFVHRSTLCTPVYVIHMFSCRISWCYSTTSSWYKEFPTFLLLSEHLPPKSPETSQILLGYLFWRIAFEGLAFHRLRIPVLYFYTTCTYTNMSYEYWVIPANQCFAVHYLSLFNA